jgi:hypothetical protein
VLRKSLHGNVVCFLGFAKAHVFDKFLVAKGNLDRCRFSLGDWHLLLLVIDESFAITQRFEMLGLRLGECALSTGQSVQKFVAPANAVFRML